MGRWASEHQHVLLSAGLTFLHFVKYYNEPAPPEGEAVDKTHPRTAEGTAVSEPCCPDGIARPRAGLEFVIVVLECVQRFAI